MSEQNLINQPEDGYPPAVQAVVDRIQDSWPATLWCEQGWWEILVRLDAELAALQPDYVLLEVKEKWGGLKVHVAVPSGAEARNAFHTAIRGAQEEAARTCEICGQPGQLRMRPPGKVRTVCDKHGEGYQLVDPDQKGQQPANDWNAGSDPLGGEVLG